MDGGAPEFVAELGLVPVKLPGLAVNELPVLVHATARQRIIGAQPRKSTHADIGQAKVLLAHAGIQPDRRRVKVPVLGEESLGKAVIAEPHLVDNRRRNHVDVGKGDQIDPGGGHGVIAGEHSTAAQKT